MNGKALFHDIIEGRAAQCGFWHGNPHSESLSKLFGYFGVKSDFELGLQLNDTLSWVQPEGSGVYKHPEGKPMFDVLLGDQRHSLGQSGCFAECESIAEVEKFPWPKLEYLDFTETLAGIEKIKSHGLAVLSGMWTSFFHTCADFFGMENYFVKMYTDPAVVEAVMDHVVSFYYEATKKLFDIAAKDIDAYFFGNDFGSQLDLLISPEMFERFIMKYFTKLVNLAKSYGIKVALHSCGAVSKAIPYLIDAGVDVLHPVQAMARDMDADSLTKKYKGKIVFMGMVDTQRLLPFGTPQQVRDEVLRLRQLLGPNLIISPSHECILPNVPPENIEAMAKAVTE